MRLFPLPFLIPVDPLNSEDESWLRALIQLKHYPSLKKLITNRIDELKEELMEKDIPGHRDRMDELKLLIQGLENRAIQRPNVDPS